ncbi:hypothetical protein OIV83_003760 [Microbotryomycetes sp. JL201]|nr:hypothetical protein OIV83_003760 [Microbotryomycetes sp. JL201]
MSFLSRLNSKSSPSSTSRGRKAADVKDEKQMLVLELSLPSPSLMDDRIITPQQLQLGTPIDSNGSVSTKTGLANAWDPDTPGADEGEEDLRAIDGQRLRDEKQRQRMIKALLSIEEATALTKECGKVIRERGLTTLGLFRPFRAVESPAQIRNLAVTFLKWSRFRQPQVTAQNLDFDARDIFSAKETQFDKLERFRKELAGSGIHDVVGVLKWGLRHLKLDKPFGGTSKFSLAWYHSFLSTSASLQHPTNAFNTILLPKLPPESQAFLTAVLDLAQAVSAYSEKNAMSPRKLCRTVGMYVFGLAPRDRQWSSWSELHGVWQEAGDALEGCLRAYLRSQRQLPPRLADLVQGFPEPRPASSKIRALTVELESKGHWQDLSEAWLVEQKVGRPARRSPADVLAATFGNGSPEEASKAQKAAWTLLKDKIKLNEADLLSEETERVFEVAAGQASVGRSSTSADQTSSNKPKPERNTPPRPSRSRSYSMGLAEQDSAGESWTGQTSPTRRWFPPPEQISPPRRNKEKSALTGSRSLGGLNERTPRQPDSAWNEFASAGFSDNPNDIRLSSPGQEEFPMRTKSGKTSKARELVGGLSPRKDRPARSVPLTKPSTKVASVSISEVDEEFPDVWYDSLSDPAACASWPSGVIGQLRAEIVDLLTELEPPLEQQGVSFLLLMDNLVSLSPAPILRESPSKRAPSVAESTMSMRWARRASSLFNVRVGKSAAEGDGVDDSPRSPERSSPRKGRALFAAQLEQKQPSHDNDSSPGMKRSSSRGILNLRRSRKSFTNDLQPEDGAQSSIPPPPPLPSDQEIEKMALRASAVPLVAIMDPNIIPVETRSANADTAEVTDGPVGNGAVGDRLDAEMERVKAEADQAKNDPSLMTAVQAALDVDPAIVKREREDEAAAAVAAATTEQDDGTNVQEKDRGLIHSHTSKKALAAIAGSVSAVTGGVAGGISALKRRTTARDHLEAPDGAADLEESIVEPRREARELEAPAMALTESQSTLDIRVLDEPQASHAPEANVVQSECVTDESMADLSAQLEDTARPSMDTVRQEQVEAVTSTRKATKAGPVASSEQPTIVATPASPLPVSPPLQSLEFEPTDQARDSRSPPSPSPKMSSSSRMSNLLKSFSGPLVQTNGNAITPSSPTPSNASNKSTSQKMMASMTGLLKRKKSTYEQELEIQRNEAQTEETRLRKLREEQVAKETKSQKGPELVSSVRKRVEEIERETVALQAAESTSLSPSRRASGSISNSLAGGVAGGRRSSRILTESPTRSLKSPARRLSSMSGTSATKRLSTEPAPSRTSVETSTLDAKSNVLADPSELPASEADLSALGIKAAVN